MGVVGVSGIGVTIVFGILIAILIAIFDGLAVLRERIEEKYGKKPIKIVRISIFSIVLIIALFLSCKYIIRPLVLRMNCEIIMSGSQPVMTVLIDDSRAMPNTVVASSEATSSNDARFDAAMASDNNVWTSWWPKEKGKRAEGEWIRLTYDEPIKVAAITVWPGSWSQADDVWYRNRPAALTIALYCGKRKIGEQYVSFGRGKNCVTLILKKPSEIDSVRVLIERVSIEKGLLGERIKRFTAISEVAVYTVYEEGSRSFVSSSGTIPDETFEKMKGQAERDYEKHVAESWGSGEELQSFTYLGYYFLTSIKEDVRSDANVLYLVYKCDVTCNGRPYSYYHFIRFDNIVMNSNGTCFVDLDDYETPSKKVYAYGYYYYGYKSIDDLFYDCVERKLSSYEYENHVVE